MTVPPKNSHKLSSRKEFWSELNKRQLCKTKDFFPSLDILNWFAYTCCHGSVTHVGSLVDAHDLLEGESELDVHGVAVVARRSRLPVVAPQQGRDETGLGIGRRPRPALGNKGFHIGWAA